MLMDSSYPPDRSDPRLVRLLQMLGGLTAQEIPLCASNPEYRLGYCWYNCFAKTRSAGGVAIHGWLLWDDGLGILDQHHSVWQDPSERLVDVTPAATNVPTTLFAPSPAHEFDYPNLKGWISVRCRTANAITLEHIACTGEVLGRHPFPGRTLLQPKPHDLDEIRQLAPHAGSERFP